MDERKQLRMKMVEYHLSYTWLIGIMRSRGLEVDKSTLSSVVNGTICGPRAEKIMSLALEILKDYEQDFVAPYAVD